MSTTLPRILIVGDSEREEMREVRKAVFDAVPADCIQSVPSVEAIAQSPVAEDWFPDLGIVCQSWPHEFAAQDVHRLLTWFPLARWVCCYGEWCDSSGRSQSVWPAALRVPAAWGAARVRQEITGLASNSSDVSPLPLTASRDEVFAFDHGAKPAPLATGEIVLTAVRSPDQALRHWIEALLRQIGCTVVTSATAGGIQALVWDIDPWNAETAGQIRRHRDRFRQIPILALAGFPRTDSSAEILRAGATVVISKLAPATEIRAALDHLTAR